MAEIGRVTETDHRMEADRGWQVGNEEILFHGFSFFESDEKVLEMDGSDGYTIL